jgi:starch synthase
VANRALENVPADRFRCRPLIELQAIRRLRAGEEQQEVMFQRNTAFQKSVPQQELAESDVVIGFDTSGWLLAERASSLGRMFVLDQSVGHQLSYAALFTMLSQRFPAWREEFKPRPEWLLRAEAAEHQLAHRIVVASSFTRRTLIENGVLPEKIVVNPYGVDLGTFVPVARPDSSRPFRFLFLGTLGVRKGVPLLLDAWRTLNRRGAELWLAGPLSQRAASLIPTVDGVTVIEKLPHRDLPVLLSKCDALVLPSYFEGFGLVLLEALAAGMPIIATEATAAPDLIEHGVEGYIVPTGDLDALRSALQRMVDSPSELAAMGAAARKCAERFSWDDYGARWRNFLHTLT